MCGIAGLVDLRLALSPSAKRKIVQQMADAMSYRGPDDSGVWGSPDERCYLSHRRLSIIDTSSAGHQPMIAADGKSGITFNGEIYNYVALKEELQKRGEHFKTASDTEVLLRALQLDGEAIVPKLDAMFAFGFYDGSSGRMILARDPFGEKPLYYSLHNGFFLFASELHALTVFPGFDATIDEDAIAEYLAFQYVPAPRSIYRRVKKLEPGHYLFLDRNGNLQIKRHFTFAPQSEPDSDVSFDALTEELEEILLRSIRSRLISDVPVGAFLSGGIDSSTVVALMRRVIGHEVQTFSLGCPGSNESEHLYARELAEYVGADHHELLVKPDMGSMAMMIGRILDEPNADSSCVPTYLLSQFARKNVTVILSGDGGDELFGGYGRYFSTMDEYGRHRAGDPNYALWSVSKAYFSTRILFFTELEVKDLLGRIPAGAAEKFDSYKTFLDNPALPPLARLRRIDLENYMPGAVLPKVDRMSMQHSLEVRCPFLNRAVAKFAEKLAPHHCYMPGQGKLILKEVAARYMTRFWQSRPKTGFGVPVGLWQQDDFVKAARRTVMARQGVLQNFISPENLNRFFERQEKGGFSAYQVWSIFVLEVWLKHHLMRQAAPEYEPRAEQNVPAEVAAGVG